MPQALRFSVLAHDLHLSNPTIPVSDFDAVLKLCRVWQWPWGGIFAYKNDMHIHVLSGYRKKVFHRKYVREVLDQMFSNYPVLTTRVLKTKPYALEFDLRMGWKICNEDATQWHLEMTEKDFNYGR
jgi:hypothetical protein